MARRPPRAARAHRPLSPLPLVQAGSRAGALDVVLTNATFALTSARMPAAPLAASDRASFAGLLVAATPGGAVVAGGKPVTLSSKGPANSAATFDFSRGTVRDWACMRGVRRGGWGGSPWRPRPPLRG